jgi:hypothetical protein
VDSGANSKNLKKQEAIRSTWAFLCGGFELYLLRSAWKYKKKAGSGTVQVGAPDGGKGQARRQGGGHVRGRSFYFISK